MVAEIGRRNHMPARRVRHDRLLQGDIVVVAMEIALQRGGAISTADLKSIMRKKYRPSGIDAQINANGQMNFDQIVGNLVSNRTKGPNMFKLGYSRRTTDGFALTDKGRAFLATLPR
jgi:hypothetical protein